MSCVHFFSPRIRVRDRLSRDETLQKPPDQSPDRQQSSRRYSHGSSAQYAPQHTEHPQQRNVYQPQPSPARHPAPSTSEYQHSGPAIDTQPMVKSSGPPEVQPRRRMNAGQMHAAHREARLEARQALKEEVHTEGLLKSRKAVLPSEIRKREKSVDDPQRGQHEETDWQTLSPERRRRNQAEEDLDRERPVERGRERTVQRIRERRTEPLSSHDGQEERVLQSIQPFHIFVHQQQRQDQSIQPVYHQEPKINQHDPPVQKQYEVRRTEHADQVQQETPRQHSHHLRLPQENQRPSQEQHVYNWRTNRLPGKEQDSQIKREESHYEKPTVQQQQQCAPSQQRLDSAAYLQKGSSVPQDKHRSMEIVGGLKPKLRTRSMSDIGLSQHTAMYRAERQGAGREAPRMVPPPGVANGEMGALDTRVSVAQLRHSYLENANRKPEL